MQSLYAMTIQTLGKEKFILRFKEIFNSLLVCPLGKEVLFKLGLSALDLGTKCETPNLDFNNPLIKF